MPDLDVNNEASQRELEQLQGEWRTVAVEVDGEAIPPWQFENARLVVAGNRFALRNPLPDSDQRTEGHLRLDPTKVPKELGLSLDDGQTIEEIYELEGDTLRVCYPVRGGRRPAEFKTVPASGLSLVLYERSRS
jgi:uncharacterized protein (TIGR03067 family)